MVGQRLQGWLQSWGVDPRDTPKAVGALLAAKYGTMALATAVGVRYRPLQRVLLNRRQVFQDTPLTQRILGAWRARRNYRKGRSWGQNFRRMRTQFREQRYVARKPDTWLAWASLKYYKLADNLQGSIGQSRVALQLSSNFGLRPQDLVLGIVEGTLLYKVTLPLTLPLYLVLIALYFKHPSPADCSKGDAAKDDQEEEDVPRASPNPGATSTFRQVRDASETALEAMEEDALLEMVRRPPSSSVQVDASNG